MAERNKTHTPNRWLRIYGEFEHTRGTVRVQESSAAVATCLVAYLTFNTWCHLTVHPRFSIYRAGATVVMREGSEAPYVIHPIKQF